MPLTACSSTVPAAPYRFWTPLAEPEQVPPYDHAASPSTLRVIGATPPRIRTVPSYGCLYEGLATFA
ncbi:hypothetical protein BT69DRAFT_1343655 [Atractiella rhizophila]|nr:hypothetical protein BT69DRAFT_1343655 [Atractiella rhizophila]